MNVEKFHASVDWLLVKSMANSPFKTCCTTCPHSYCCSEAAYAEVSEVFWMLDSLDEQEKSRVAARTAAWLDRVSDSPLMGEDLPNAMAWRELNAPCPLLENGRCMAYQRRPMGCRTFFAMGNPDDCAMPNRKHQKIGEFPGEFHMYLNQLCPPESGQTLHIDHIGLHLADLLLGIKKTSGSVHAFTWL